MIEDCGINIWFNDLTEEEILKNISVFLETNKQIISSIYQQAEGKKIDNYMLLDDINHVRVLVLCTLWYLYNFKTKTKELDDIISEVENIRYKIKHLMWEDKNSNNNIV